MKTQLQITNPGSHPHVRAGSTCACGGECESRSHKKLSFQRSVDDRDSMNAPKAGEPSLAHDFSRLRVHGSSPEIAVSHELPPGSDPDTVKYSPDGVFLDLDGSGTCSNGGGSSGCNPSTGVYGLVSNDNTCCTTECTAAHEAVHKKDHDDWGCCKAFSTAWNAKGADQPALTKKFSEWAKKVGVITECHAYTKSVACASDLATTNDCDGKGKDTNCCKDIAEYKAGNMDMAAAMCSAAPKKAAPCPF